MKKTGLFKNITWQASTDAEAQDIFKTFGTGENTKIFKAENVFIAPDIGVSPNSLNGINKATTDKLRIIFLSRISVVKNLLYLLNCLLKVTSNVTLSIYGPKEDQVYWDKCQHVIDIMPKNIDIHYFGAIPHEQTGSVFAAHDLFFLPTLGENFGHVIIESLSSGTPVLISDQTPWKSDINGACIALPLNNSQDFIDVVEHFSNSSIEEKKLRSNAARKLAMEFSNEKSTLNKNIELFEFASKKRPSES